MNLFPETDETKDCSSSGVIIGGINSSSIKAQKNDCRASSTSSTKSTSTLDLVLVFSLQLYCSLLLCVKLLNQYNFIFKPSNCSLITNQFHSLKSKQIMVKAFGNP